jgi:hypothetical protein
MTAAATKTVAAWSIKLSHALDNAAKKEPETKTVERFQLLRDPEGVFYLDPRPSFTGIVDAKSDRPGKFNDVDDTELDDPDKLEEFFTRGQCYRVWTDKQAWTALRNAADRMNLQGDAPTQASRYMACLLVLRAGISNVTPLTLAYEGVN